MAYSDGKGVTYSSKCNNLTRELSANILRDTIEIEDKLRESLAVMSLPLTNVIQCIRGWPLALGSLDDRLPFPISRSNELLFKRAGVSVVGSASKEPGLSALLNGGSTPRGRPSLLLRDIHHLLFGRRLAVWDLNLSRPGSFGRQEPGPVGRIGCIRHVGERASSRHVQGGLGGGGHEYSGHVDTISLLDRSSVSIASILHS